MANSDSSALPPNDQNPSNTNNTNDQSPTSTINNQPHQPPAVSTIITIKLTRSNYPLWLAQISPILRSRDLFGYVDGTVLCPPKFLPGRDESVVNPSYPYWVQQDQTILSWINNSLTPSVLSTVALSPTSRQSWLSLERRYASTSHNRILHLRNELLRTAKGDLSVSDYLDKINSIADNLALAGSPIMDPDLVTIIMNNVGPAFEVTVSAAQARDTPITYEALEALLLTTERRQGYSTYD
ncbi:PREDICTED: uncharacterized protein LOC103333312 [Prunus mume]|uniref:Uncharacterized protein LOC103333312 n=1 Tax=Prunus mume TaxID=102107 RepID=A0ABM0P4Q2_PRUMU|nr:PREDICTED: uncharacterized protein LOC103333312 [Prunus mume]